MIRLSQPSDYRFRGRVVWVNPNEVVTVTTSDYTNYGECIVKLKDGTSFTANGSKDDVAEKINNALEETK